MNPFLDKVKRVLTSRLAATFGGLWLRIMAFFEPCGFSRLQWVDHSHLLAQKTPE